MEPEVVARWLDLAGVIAFAVSGATLAVRKGFDVVGVVVLAIVTGLGGGMVRDVLIDAGPPIALQEGRYLVAAVVSGLVVLVLPRRIDRIRRPVLAFDAVGLGLFAVSGAARTLAFGLGWGAAVLLGTITAVGGGVLRDVLAGDVPLTFRSGGVLYAIPAAAGATVVVVLWETGTYGAFSELAVAAAVTVLRLLALRLRWRAPTARPGRRW